MPFFSPRSWSLKTNINLASLIIFLLSTWSLAYWVSRLMRDDIVNVLGEQQFAMTTLLAKDLKEDLVELMAAW